MTFALDKTNAQLMGVCAGLARSTDIDITLIRAGMIIATLIVSGATIPLYLIAAFVAPKG